MAGIASVGIRVDRVSSPDGSRVVPHVFAIAAIDDAARPLLDALAKADVVSCGVQQAPGAGAEDLCIVCTSLPRTWDKTMPVTASAREPRDFVAVLRAALADDGEVFLYAGGVKEEASAAALTLTFGFESPDSGADAGTPPAVAELTPLSAWPGVTASWRASGDESIAIAIDWRMPQGDPSALARRWETIGTQLQEAGTAWSVSSTLGAKERSLTESERGALRSFAADVRAAIAGTGSVGPVTLTVKTNAANRETFARLAATLHARRPPSSGAADSEIAVDPSLTDPQLAKMLAKNFGGLLLAYDTGVTGARVPFGVAPHALDIKPTSKPAFYAPPPLSRELQSLPDARIPAFSPDRGGQDTVATITNADLDVLMRECLDDIESMLAPAAILDARRVADARTVQAIDMLIRSKAAIADALAARTLPVLKGDASGKAARAARDHLAARFRRNLRSVYRIKAVAAVEVSNGAPPVFPYDGAFDATTARLPLEFSMTHVGAGPDWRLTLHAPKHVSLGSADVPLPVRECPPPPQPVSHEVMAMTDGTSTTAAGRFAEARKWAYRFRYARRAIPHDIVSATIAHARSAGPQPPRVPSRQLAALLTTLSAFGWNRHALAETASGPAIRFVALLARDLASNLVSLGSPADDRGPRSADVARLRIDDRTDTPAVTLEGQPAGLAADIRRVGAGGAHLTFDVTVSGYAVPQDRCARAALSVERNVSLVAGRETTDAFVYASREAAFGPPACVSVDRDVEIDLAELGGATTTERVTGFFERLFDGFAMPLTIGLSVTHVYRLPEIGIETESAVLAVAPREFNDAAALARPLGAQIDGWSRATAPAPGRLRLDVTVFDAPSDPRAGSARPMLRLRRVMAPIEVLR
jgi:hypothetical protein